jgi:hypothetical protein
LSGETVQPEYTWTGMLNAVKEAKKPAKKATKAAGEKNMQTKKAGSDQ